MNTFRREITPGTVLRLIKSDGAPLWINKVNKKCRVGFYSHLDGLNIIWIVDQFGNYTETTDLHDLFEWFEILEVSSNTDYFGDESEPIQSIENGSEDWKWSM